MFSLTQLKIIQAAMRNPTNGYPFEVLDDVREIRDTLAREIADGDAAANLQAAAKGSPLQAVG